MMMTPTRTAALVTLAASGLLVAGCGAPAPAVPAVDLGASSALPSAAAPAPAPIGGEYTAPTDAATVRLAVTDSMIEVVESTPAPGWQQVEDDRRPREVDLAFVRDGTTVSVDAEIDDGRFETDVDVDAPATPGRSTYRVGDAGSLTIEVVGDRVGLVGQETGPGWVTTVDERELAEGEVAVRFRNDGESRTVDVDADIDDGRLSVEIDSRTGRDYAAPPVR